MKLIRFGKSGYEKPGIILPDSSRRDVSEFVNDYDESFFENEGIEKLQKIVE